MGLCLRKEMPAVAAADGDDDRHSGLSKKHTADCILPPMFLLSYFDNMI